MQALILLQVSSLLCWLHVSFSSFSWKLTRINYIPHFSQGRQTSVEFVLNGDLANKISRKLHKCEMNVKIKTESGLHSGVQQPPVCHKYIETFYGAFTDICQHEGNEFMEFWWLFHLNAIWSSWSTLYWLGVLCATNVSTGQFFFHWEL